MMGRESFLLRQDGFHSELVELVRGLNVRRITMLGNVVKLELDGACTQSLRKVRGIVGMKVNMQ